MSKTAKKQKSPTEKTAQASRSQKNKFRRINRNRPTGTKNESHLRNLARKRIERLERAFKRCPADKDRQAQITQRLNQLQPV
jgi:hypothetical protein